MKTRRVVVTIELETDLPLATLRELAFWSGDAGPQTEFLQISANVIRPKPVRNLPRRKKAKAAR